MAFDDNKDTLLARWLSGELEEEELKSLESQPDFEDLEKIIKATDKLEMPAFDKKEALANLKKRTKTQQKNETPKIRRLPFLRYAAVASILLLVGFFFFNPFTDNITSFETQIAQEEKINLPDGSEIWLNESSQLSFNEGNWEESRVVNLEGEAFFNVKKGSTFKVISDKGTVQVLGTSFNVFTRNDYFEVNCHTGKVEVVAKTTNNTIQLNPGDKIIEQGDNFNTFKFSPNGKPYWKEEVSNFKDTPLYIVISQLEYLFDIEIKMNNVDSQEKFTGSFIHNDKAAALKMVFDPMGIQYQVNDKVVELKK